MDEAELNELKMLSSYQGSYRSKRLKKTVKDKCLVLGETTMYYGNFGSIQVMSPIPGSPNLDSEAGSVLIHMSSPKETVLSLQPEQQVTPKKGKKVTSQRKKSTPGDKKNTSLKYDLPPLKAAHAGVNYNRCPPRVSTGSEPCHFRPSSDIEFTRNENVLMSTDAWIPHPGFKPSEKKTMSKHTFTAKSSKLKYGSLGKPIEPTNRVQASSSLVTTSLNCVHLPAIPGATRTSLCSHILQPTPQYINIYKDDGHLPPLNVSTVSIANRRVNKSTTTQRVTNGRRH